jgi:hypothetical protein
VKLINPNVKAPRWVLSPIKSVVNAWLVTNMTEQAIPEMIKIQKCININVNSYLT